MSNYGEKPCNVAEILADLYTRNFGGRQETRYRISRKNFRVISRLRILTDDYVKKVMEELMEMEPGYALINMDKYFAVLPIKNFLSYRRVTESALEEILKDFCSKHNVEYNYLLSDRSTDNQSGED